jgi:hypothetical protein
LARHQFWVPRGRFGNSQSIIVGAWTGDVGASRVLQCCRDRRDFGVTSANLTVREITECIFGEPRRGSMIGVISFVGRRRNPASLSLIVSQFMKLPVAALATERTRGIVFAEPRRKSASQDQVPSVGRPRPRAAQHRR